MAFSGPIINELLQFAKSGLIQAEDFKSIGHPIDDVALQFVFNFFCFMKFFTILRLLGVFLFLSTFVLATSQSGNPKGKTKKKVPKRNDSSSTPGNKKAVKRKIADKKSAKTNTPKSKLTVVDKKSAKTNTPKSKLTVVDKKSAKTNTPKSKLTVVDKKNAKTKTSKSKLTVSNSTAQVNNETNTVVGEESKVTPVPEILATSSDANPEFKDNPSKEPIESNVVTSHSVSSDFGNISNIANGKEKTTLDMMLKDGDIQKKDLDANPKIDALHLDKSDEIEAAKATNPINLSEIQPVTISTSVKTIKSDTADLGHTVINLKENTPAIEETQSNGNSLDEKSNSVIVHEEKFQLEDSCTESPESSISITTSIEDSTNNNGSPDNSESIAIEELSKKQDQPLPPPFVASCEPALKEEHFSNKPVFTDMNSLDAQENLFEEAPVNFITGTPKPLKEKQSKKEAVGSRPRTKPLRAQYFATVETPKSALNTTQLISEKPIDPICSKKNDETVVVAKPPFDTKPRSNDVNEGKITALRKLVGVRGTSVAPSNMFVMTIEKLLELKHKKKMEEQEQTSETKSEEQKSETKSKYSNGELIHVHKPKIAIKRQAAPKKPFQNTFGSQLGTDSFSSETFIQSGNSTVMASVSAEKSVDEKPIIQTSKIETKLLKQNDKPVTVHAPVKRAVKKIGQITKTVKAMERNRSQSESAPPNPTNPSVTSVAVNRARKVDSPHPSTKKPPQISVSLQSSQLRLSSPLSPNMQQATNGFTIERDGLAARGRSASTMSLPSSQRVKAFAQLPLTLNKHLKDDKQPIYASSQNSSDTNKRSTQISVFFRNNKKANLEKTNSFRSKTPDQPKRFSLAPKPSPAPLPITKNDLLRQKSDRRVERRNSDSSVYSTEDSSGSQDN